MKLSVAIPAFNRPVELKEALESLAFECTKDIEIVISEDHSPLRDKISEIVKATALEFNLPYNSQRTWGDALVSHTKMLYDLGHYDNAPGLH